MRTIRRLVRSVLDIISRIPIERRVMNRPVQVELEDLRQLMSHLDDAAVHIDNCFLPASQLFEVRNKARQAADRIRRARAIVGTRWGMGKQEAA